MPEIQTAKPTRWTLQGAHDTVVIVSMADDPTVSAGFVVEDSAGRLRAETAGSFEQAERYAHRMLDDLAAWNEHKQAMRDIEAKWGAPGGQSLEGISKGLRAREALLR